MQEKILRIFLSFDAADRAAAARIRSHLGAREAATFLHRGHLAVGRPWPRALGDALDACRSAAVFVGRRPDLGTWQLREISLAQDRRRRASLEGESFPVVPVLLPGADPRLGFLLPDSWVDLRGGIAADDDIDRLARALRAPPRAGEAVGTASTEVCPYRGLASFRREDEPFFFGRENFTARLLEKVLEHDLVAVVGPSGSGKSSVVQAGLLPALGRHPEGRAWEVVTLRPGDRPFHCLAHAMAPLRWPHLDDLGQEEKAERLGDQLREQRNRLEIQVEKALAGSGGSTRLLLVVDQFEELFRETSAGLREPFVNSVLGALDHCRLSVVFTLRADFVDHVLRLGTGLADRFYDRVVYLSDQLGQDVMARVVRSPADRVGLELEEDLERVVLRDVGGGPGRLPLLEFCLQGLWEERRDGCLTHAGYEKIGGVEGALAQHAERALADLGSSLGLAARRLFIDRLVRVASEGEAGKDTKRKADLADLPGDEREVVAHLSGPGLRLLVAGESSVEIVHDSLLDSWSTLKEWLRTDRERLRQEQQMRGVQAIRRLVATMVLDEAFVDQPGTFLRAVRDRLVVLANDGAPYENLSESLWRLDYLAAKGGSEATRARARELGLELRVALERAVLNRSGNLPPRFDTETFALIEPGLAALSCGSGGTVKASFLMGSEERENERPVHPVVLSPYRIQVCTVTHGDYLRFDPRHGEPVLEEGGSDALEDGLPVVDVTWHQAYAYAAWLGGRLPTEAEWECACRAATTTRWSFGDDESRIGRYAWIAATSGKVLHPPGELEPNPWGLYDMHGNLWEWVSDKWGDYPPELETDPLGSPFSSDRRVIRGGSFVVGPVGARCAYRVGVMPSSHGNDVGFRLVLPASQPL